jgi:hypothetical protein
MKAILGLAAALLALPPAAGEATPLAAQRPTLCPGLRGDPLIRCLEGWIASRQPGPAPRAPPPSAWIRLKRLACEAPPLAREAGALAGQETAAHLATRLLRSAGPDEHWLAARMGKVAFGMLLQRLQGKCARPW